MKTIIAAIAMLGAIGSFTGAAIADVSININLGSSPSYRSYSPYRPKIYRTDYHRNTYYNNYDPYNRNSNSTFIVRDVYPANTYPANIYYDSMWNYSVPLPNVYRSNLPERRHNTYQGDRYIVEKRIIRVR